MSDDDQTQPVRPGDPAATPAPTPAPPPPPPAASEAAVETAGETATPPTTGRRGFRERLRALRRSDGSRTYGLAALIASALAGVIVGGLGFAAVHAISDDRDRDRDHDRGAWVERRDGEGPGRGGMHGGPRGVPGQLPPTTAPEDEDGSAS